jgi:hypothetical protein
MAPKDTPPVGGSVNPYDFLSLVAALSASQSKPSQGGINRLFMPEVGALTGTLFQGDVGAQSQQEEAATMLRLAPDILRASNLPVGDPRAKIANMIFVQKIPVWDVKRRIDQELLERQKMGEAIDIKETAPELYSFADKIQSQSDALEANMATAAAKPKTDVFTQAGLPSPEMQFAPEELAPDYFKRYAEESAKRGEQMRQIQAPSAASRRQALKFITEQEKIREKASKPMGGIEAIGAFFRGAGAAITGGDVDKVMSRRVGGTPDPEMRRFENVAKGIVARGPENKELSSQRAALVKEQRLADTVRDLVASGLTQKAQEAGYTPLMIALLKRAQFSGLGGG